MTTTARTATWNADTVEAAFASLPSTSATVPTIPAKASAAALRHDLKATFGQTFSVTMSRGTGYGWVAVSWFDGPVWRDVQKVSHRYQDEQFDGMTDSYVPVNTDAPVRYTLSGVNHTRQMGETGRAFVAAIFDQAGITDYTTALREGAKDMAGTFAWERRLTDAEQSALISVLGLTSFDPFTMENAASAARLIHSRTDFTAKAPAFNPDLR